MSPPNRGSRGGETPAPHKHPRPGNRSPKATDPSPKAQTDDEDDDPFALLLKNSPTVVARYDYPDENGDNLFQVRRWEPGRDGKRKSFTQHRWNGRRYEQRLNGARRVLYRLPELIASADSDEEVWIVEGEKDVHALVERGKTATCNPGGASKWRPEYNEFLRGRVVRVIADRDESGRKHAADIYENLKGVARSVSVYQVTQGKDVTELLELHDYEGDTWFGLGLEPLSPKDLASPAERRPRAAQADETTADVPHVLQHVLGVLVAAQPAVAPHPPAVAGGDWQVCCPVHDDTSPSATVRAGGRRPIVFHCHAGCDQEDFFAWLVAHGVSRDELMDTQRPSGVHGFALNDTGMAKRLVAHFGSVVRYCHPKKKWYVWNERYWQVDDTGALMRHAKETARRLHAEALDTTDEAARKAIAKAAHSYASTMKLKLLVENAQSEDGIAILPQEMDPDPFLFCVENGTLNLRTGGLQPHRPEDFITRMAPVEFHSHARDDRWSQFLRYATGDDDELGRFLQRAAFASLVGAVQDKAFAYLRGPGNTGKTSFLELLTATWGPAYSGAVEGDTFLKRSYVGGMRADLARMDGKRIVISNEMGDGQINEPLLKKLTGGDRVVFEEKYVNPWENDASFTIWMAGNDVPKALAESEALWNRWRQVPFLNVIPKADPKWLDRVKADPTMRSAVLAWAVRGRRGWERQGIGTTPAVERATQAVRKEMDPLREFWEDCCQFGENYWMETSLLRRAYGQWCHRRGQHSINDKAFHKLLRNKGCSPKIQRVDGQKRRIWIGIKVAG